MVISAYYCHLPVTATPFYRERAVAQRLYSLLYFSQKHLFLINV
jgi:hypothetical protein